MDYEEVELLLISKKKESLSYRENEVKFCLEKINPDNLSEGFAKIGSPEDLAPIKE